MCATGYGIRRSKDLRAESGKCPISTNERKNMSTKTNFKRVALVAVAALGLGVLTSVAPANAAGTAPDRDVYDYVNSSSFGVCAAATDRAASDVGAGQTYVTATLANAAQVGEILSNGSVVFTGGNTATDIDSAESVTIAVTGPGSITAVDQASMTTSLVFGTAGSSLTSVSTGANQVPVKGFTVTANGAGTIQVTISSTIGTTSTTVEIYSFISSASCVTGNASVANSIVKVDLYDSTPTAAESTTNSTTTAAAVVAGDDFTGGLFAVNAANIANGGAGYVDIVVKDGTTAATTLDSSAAGIFTASATNGAVIYWTSGTGTTSATNQASSATVTQTGEKFNRLVVTQGLANKDKPMSTVVTMYFNGVVYGTRTINFTGKATKIEISAADSAVGKAGQNSMAVGVYEITDSAGNKLTSAGPGTGVAGTSTSNVPVLATSGVVVDTVNQSTVTAVNLADAAAVSYTDDSGYAGSFSWTCGTSKSGTAKVYLKYTFSDLTSLVSNQYDAACGQDPVNYKASLDKATYAPGDLATLTITATDKTGAAVWDANEDGDAIALGDAEDQVSIYLPLLTAITAPTNSDYFSGSKKTYKFSVGATEGSYNGVVNLPAYNGTTYSQSALTLPFTIKAPSTGAVSNADVLKAIVSLIASINKQIAALQKALLKK